MFAPEGCSVILLALFAVIVFHCPLCKWLQYLTGVEIHKKKRKGIKIKASPAIRSQKYFSSEKWFPQVTD